MNRILRLVALLMLFGSELRAAEITPSPILDCHVHLWELARPEGIGWIPKDDKTLYRDFLPRDHEPIAEANHVQAVVVVQAGQSLVDNQWNLDVTAHNKSLYRGVVGNLSKIIGTPEFRPMFEKLCADPRYVGYRLSGRYRKELDDAFYRDVRLTAEKGKTIDFLPNEYTLDEIAEIARRVPNLRIVLDHFGNVRLKDAPLDEAWVKSLRNIGKHENVFCKVSALYGRVQIQPAPRTIEFYEPVLDLAFECFGADRLLYGSDWPVSETTGDYASVVKLTRAYFDRKGKDVSEKLFWKNGMKIYQVPEQQPEASQPR